MDYFYMESNISDLIGILTIFAGIRMAFTGITVKRWQYAAQARHYEGRPRPSFDVYVDYFLGLLGVVIFWFSHANDIFEKSVAVLLILNGIVAFIFRNARSRRTLSGIHPNHLRWLCFAAAAVLIYSGMSYMLGWGMEIVLVVDGEVMPTPDGEWVNLSGGIK